LKAYTEIEKIHRKKRQKWNS